MQFHPIVVGALYPGVARGLTADVLATQAVGGRAFSVCTAHVVAGRGVVTDVLNVPTDTVAAQLEHLAETETPTAAKIGVIGDAPTVHSTFDHVGRLDGPLLLDLTLSGPSGEDVLGQRGLEALMEHLGQADLVTLGKRDASLVAEMEIRSLDDAQVAVQRIGQRGARRVILRCGRLPTHHYDTESSPPDYAVDLYFDGEDIALFEAPFLENIDRVQGASSGLSLLLLKSMQQGMSVEAAMQKAKGRVSEALRHVQQRSSSDPSSSFFDGLREHSGVVDLEVDDLIDS